jgi:hypothetical protein
MVACPTLREIVGKVLVMMGKGPMACGDLFKIRDLRQRYQKHIYIYMGFVKFVKTYTNI